jgi:hypothetical protein
MTPFLGKVLAAAQENFTFYFFVKVCEGELLARAASIEWCSPSEVWRVRCY